MMEAKKKWITKNKYFSSFINVPHNGRAGMVVQTVLTDMEFDKTIDKLSDQTVVNTFTAQEHVAEIECQIRTTKERCHAIVSTLPFAILPKFIVTNIVYFVVLWLNIFPVQNGVSKVSSPCSIILRNKLTWKRHCKVTFGTYCEMHDKPDPSNDMTPRTHEEIVVGPTGNIQGTYKFFGVEVWTMAWSSRGEISPNSTCLIA